MKPSTAAVLALLRERPQGVTPLTALERVGTYRLAARIEELRKAGYPVVTERFVTHRGASVALYKLNEAAA